MGLDDLLISTGVDGLIKLVHERGKVELKAAAVDLKVPESTVEDWAHVLESEGLVKIQYQLTSVYLVWASMAPAQYAKATQTIDAKKSQTVQKLEGLSRSVEQSSNDIKSIKTQFGSLLERNHAQLDVLARDLNEAEKLNAQAHDLVNGKQVRLRELRAELGQMAADMEGFEAEMRKRPSEKAQAEVAAVLDSLKQAEVKLDNKLHESREQFARVGGQVQSLVAHLSEDKTAGEMARLKGALEDLKFAKGELNKTLQNVREEVKTIGDEIAQVTDQLRQMEEKRGAAGNPKKLMEQLESLSAQVGKDREVVLGDLERNLETVRRQLTTYSQLQYQHQTIQGRLDAVRSQYKRETEEVERFFSTLDEAGKRYAKDLEAAMSSLEAERKEFEEMSKKATLLENLLSNINDLESEGDRLAIKLKGLIKEANAVSMAAPPGAAATMGVGGPKASALPKGAIGAGAPGGPAGAEPALPPELMQRIALTAAEEEAFEKKREELRYLIYKMWEDDRKPPHT